jgi:hypothetical protein
MPISWLELGISNLQHRDDLLSILQDSLSTTDVWCQPVRILDVVDNSWLVLKSFCIDYYLIQSLV